VSQPSTGEHSSMVAREGQPLISVFVRENGHDVVRYFVDQAAADAAVTDEDVKRALQLAGAWSDLDWDEVEAELYRIGHEAPPSPPIGL
jgi:hypothetical protein